MFSVLSASLRRAPMLWCCPSCQYIASIPASISIVFHHLTLFILSFPPWPFCSAPPQACFFPSPSLQWISCFSFEMCFNLSLSLVLLLSFFRVMCYFCFSFSSKVCQLSSASLRWANINHFTQASSNETRRWKFPASKKRATFTFFLKYNSSSLDFMKNDKDPLS